MNAYHPEGKMPFIGTFKRLDDEKLAGDQFPASSPKNSPSNDQQHQRARTIYLHSVSFLHPAVLVEIDSTLKQFQDILNKGTVSHLSVEGVHAKGPALSGQVVHGSEHRSFLREPLELASSPEACLSQEGLTIGLALSGQHARHLCQPPEDHLNI